MDNLEPTLSVIIIHNVHGDARSSSSYKLKFIEALDNKLDLFHDNHPNTPTILGGDFNISCDEEDVAGQALMSLMVKHNLLDSFHEIHPCHIKTPGFTRAPTGNQNGRPRRIDHIFISQDFLIPQNCSLKFTLSDHCQLSVNFTLDKNSNTRAIPKPPPFPDQILEDTEVCETLNNAIRNILLHETPNQTNNLSNCELTKKILTYTPLNPVNLYYKIMSKLISIGLNQAAKLRAKANTEMEKLLKTIRHLEPDLPFMSESRKCEYIALLDSYKDHLYRQEVCIAQNRHIQWEQLGQRNTRYFIRMQNRKSKESRIKSLLINGNIETDKPIIDAHIHNFYEQLFKPSETSLSLQDFNINPLKNLITNQEKEHLNQDLTLHESTQAVNQLSDNATAGHDQVTSKLLKFVTKEVPYLINQVHRQLMTDSDETANHIAFRILKKPNKPDYLSMNRYRPIALMNSIVKSLHKAIFNRMAPILSSHPEITGCKNYAYKRGAATHDATAMVVDALEFAKKNCIPDFLVICRDFSKAFNSLQSNYIQAILAHFGFPDKILNFFQSLHTNTWGSILGSSLDSKFKLDAGAPQGSCLAGILFNISLSPLAWRLENSPILRPLSRGFCSPNTGDPVFLCFNKTAGFSDDLDILTRVSFNSDNTSPELDEIEHLFEQFNQLTNLKLSDEKGICFSHSISDTTNKVINHYNYDYKTHFRHLGAHLNAHSTSDSQPIISHLERKVKNIASSFPSGTNFIGRSALANTFILPCIQL